MLSGFALGAFLLAATATPAPPAHSFTATMERAVDDLGNHIVQEKRSPGLAIGIVEDGRIVYARGFGYSDLAKHTRWSPSTQTYVGSISKQFTAAAILLLQQAGKLKLDDPVTRYVPELTIANGVTIRELLNQTAGMPDELDAKGIDQDRTKSIKLADLTRRDEQTPTGFSAGYAISLQQFQLHDCGIDRRARERRSRSPTTCSKTSSYLS